ncbi:DivIVA domain-containing protein [Actinomyces qiguomingii]|uniref:DivIVA domain-containing protein n=1 Tax=Actinomyces qiguomingii TaxID=2057800 RepID=UPI00157F84BB
MTLTTDDILNKKFRATKFREGYERDEVDEFLDEVIDAMRRLENELASERSRTARLERANARLMGMGGVTPGA